MGCGVSVSDIVGPIVRELVEPNAHRRTVEVNGNVPNLERLAFGLLKRHIIDDILDKGTVSPVVISQKVNKLPVGSFTDGMLGVLMNERDLTTTLNSLGDDELFNDLDFAADGRALKFNGHEFDPDVIWIRPKDMVTDPRLMVEGAGRKDIQQGALGDCWFLSACASVAQRPDLMAKVIPPNQKLCGVGYRGAVRFRFWRFGQWVTVCVDDRLPTKNGKLIYGRCTERREFWVPLLEKAYAKLHGSYEALDGGLSKDALVDLTGGLAQCFGLEVAGDDLFAHMQAIAQHGNAFITCARKGDYKVNEADSSGLVSGHAYTVTDVKNVSINKIGVELMRIRNPWGDATEWKGAWGDCNSVWDSVDEDTKQAMGFESSADGEFWMSFDDFCTHFQEVTVCTLGVDSNRDGIMDSHQVTSVKSKWELGYTCGGCRNDLGKFASNPQFLLAIEDEEGADGTVVVGLMQEHRRSDRGKRLESLQIGFSIYKVEHAAGRLSVEFFLVNQDCANSGAYINYREVTAHFELDPGRYVIVPATFAPDCPSNFLLRVFSDRSCELEELGDNLPGLGW